MPAQLIENDYQFDKLILMVVVCYVYAAAQILLIELKAHYFQSACHAEVRIRKTHEGQLI